LLNQLEESIKGLEAAKGLPAFFLDDVRPTDTEDTH
jgi:hypothetical protein